MVAFPRSGVGPGQRLELLPEPGSQLGGWFPAALRYQESQQVQSPHARGCWWGAAAPVPFWN